MVNSDDLLDCVGEAFKADWSPFRELARNFEDSSIGAPCFDGGVLACNNNIL